MNNKPVPISHQPNPLRTSPAGNRAKDDHPQAASARPKQVKVVFWDDEASFLSGLSLARPEQEGLDLRTLLADESNPLLNQLNVWAEAGWRPDLICIDLNSASGSGLAGKDQLQALRQASAWRATPVVMNTQTINANEEQSRTDLIHTIYDCGADGYLLGKNWGRDYLKQLVYQLPAWRHHARSRMWRNLLEKNHEALRNSTSEDEQQKALQTTLNELPDMLGMSDAFIRRGTANHCPIWAKTGGEWTQAGDVTKLSDIPMLMKMVDAQGRVEVFTPITAQDCGPYKALVGRSVMGYAMFWQTQLLGVMTVVGATSIGADGFDLLDRQYFQSLAEQVASVLGTQSQKEQRRKLREALAEFGLNLSHADDERSLCTALATTAHKVVHEALPTDVMAKCTVRLIEPGYPWLRRYGAAGDTLVNAADISLNKPERTTHNSMARQAVRQVRPQVANNQQELIELHHLDHNLDPSGRPWWKAQSAITLPLALERPDSTPEKPERSALGSLHLECSQADMYTPEVQTFLESLALSASRHITALRTARFAEMALDLSVQAYAATPNALWKKMHQVLLTLLGYNLLIQLDPPEGRDGQTAKAVWRVQRVYASDAARYRCEAASWQDEMDRSDWPQTFLHKSIQAFLDDASSGPRFTADKNDFVQVDNISLLDGVEVEAQAALPLWQSSAGQPTRLGGVVLLSWLSPPVMDRAMFSQVLSRFASAGAQLLQHSTARQTGEAHLQRAMAESQVAQAARQFEHVLNNSLAALQGATSHGINSSDLPQAKTQLFVIREGLKRLQLRANKSAMYFKDPTLGPVEMPVLWTSVVEELKPKAEQHQVRMHAWGSSPQGGLPLAPTTAYSDQKYLWNALYVLLDNAIEALATQPASVARDVWVSHCASDGQRLCWHVHDNGPGVADPDTLFAYGKSTKPNGQGVALALAQERLALAQAYLTYVAPENRTDKGAVFAISLPLQG